MEDSCMSRCVSKVMAFIVSTLAVLAAGCGTDRWALRLGLEAQARGSWDPRDGAPLPWPVLSYEATSFTQELLAPLGISRIDLRMRDVGRLAVEALCERIDHDGRSSPVRYVEAQYLPARKTRR